MGIQAGQQTAATASASPNAAIGGKGGAGGNGQAGGFNWESFNSGPYNAASSAGGQTAGGQPPNMFQQASNAINAGMAGAYGEMGYNPMMVDPSQFAANDQVGYQSIDPNAANWEAAQTTQADMDRFYNPYVNQVVDTSLSDIDRARQMQQNQAAAQAQAAGAFGGSRGALMQTEIGRNALDEAARTGSQLRSAGFTQAANLAQQDVGRRQQANQMNAAQQMQAMLANQSAGLQASTANSRLSQANAQNALQAMLANQGMQLAGSGQRLAAGQQLANIGNLGFGQAQDVQSNFQQQGAMQQALQQQLINAGKQQYQGYTGFPQQSLGYYSQALGASQIPQSQTTTSDPGLFGWASMLLGSDIRFKENIRPAGQTAGGHNLYMWDWNDTAKDVLGEEGSAMGVIAQEVKETNPELVVEFDDGYYRVNYGGIQ